MKTLKIRSKLAGFLVLGVMSCSKIKLGIIIYSWFNRTFLIKRESFYKIDKYDEEIVNWERK